MPRKKNFDQVAIPVPGNYSPPPARAIEKQSSWSGEPWREGQIPRAPLRTVHSGPKQRMPYGEEMGVQCPETRGSMNVGAPGEAD
jgi:hypothetical protein